MAEGYLGSGIAWFYYDETNVIANYAGIDRNQHLAYGFVPIDPDMEMDIGL